MATNVGVCNEHRRVTVADLLSDRIWNGVCDQFAKRKYPPPVRELTEVFFKKV